MKLTYRPRKAERKSEAKTLRREGDIPAVLYSCAKAAEPIAIDGNAFRGLLRDIVPGRLSTIIFELSSDNGNRRAILKEIQYEPTTYEVRHLDFEELHEEQKVNIKVPIECFGAAECPGVKLGGVLRMVIRSLKVRCLPRDIPEVFKLDVRTLGPRESRRLRDVELPDTVRPLDNLNEVAVVIAKR
jgi:large subunit ribosomal protein L25